MSQGQSRKASLLESCLNTSSGFVVALITWQFLVCPLFHIKMGFGSNLLITGIFTVVSITRSYIWRRVFNHIMVRRGNDFNS